MKVRVPGVLLLLATAFGAVHAEVPKLYLGADLSYVNEVEDCGAVFRKDGKKVDPFKLFAAGEARSRTDSCVLRERARSGSLAVELEDGGRDAR